MLNWYLAEEGGAAGDEELDDLLNFCFYSYIFALRSPVTETPGNVCVCMYVGRQQQPSLRGSAIAVD